MEKEIKEKLKLTPKDLEDLQNRGILPEDLERQANRLKHGTNYVNLLKECIIDDGIKKIKKEEYDNLVSLHDEFSLEGRHMKFVPASGAASRMFKKLQSVLNSQSKLNKKALENKREEEDYKFTLELLNNIKRFAFYDDLREELNRKGFKLDEMLKEGELKTILENLIYPEGMNYSNLSKALLKFHQYGVESRTALEEQIAEGINYITNQNKEAVFHFTVSPEQEDKFKELAEQLIQKYSLKGYKLKISFSFQKKSTDTAALDMEGNLFRDEDGLLFRPGGHGALIQNLNDLKGDIVFIKNIDNVQREENFWTTVLYKKLISGLLIKLQGQIFEYLRMLEKDSISHDDIKKIENFIADDLNIQLPAEYQNKGFIEKFSFLKYLLNRPIRVAGMVENEGHPGGGPFWVKEKNGSISKQIVEESQVDKSEEEQKRIFASSTHFNPVDLVCGLRNYKGQSFDLNNYVDNEAVFIAKKSKDGKDLKALELPGLWNGAMHNWITIFAEVPKCTFTPVKEINDLLQDYHLG